MDAIDEALAMEEEAVDFYTRCAEKTQNPVGRRMFLSIAGDERYHIACALEVRKGVPVPLSSSSPITNLRKDFEKHKETILGEVSASADDLEALTTALRMEKEAIAFYRTAAGQAKTSAEKNFFECLIRDEEEHFRIFQNTYTFLADSGNWYMWEDHSIVEG